MSTDITFVSPEDLAKMLHLSRKTVIDSYTKQQGFPKSVTGQRKPRWLESEVRKFFERASEQNANN